jgi:hypothetical protein
MLQTEITYLNRWKGAHRTKRHGCRGGIRRMFFDTAMISLRKQSKNLKSLHENLIKLKGYHEKRMGK